MIGRLLSFPFLVLAAAAMFLAFACGGESEETFSDYAVRFFKY
jgi:hypothetical protein